MFCSPSGAARPQRRFAFELRGKGIRSSGLARISHPTERAGLSSAKWITVDDTGARHKAANGFCTQIGNAHFAWFGTTGSKNRGNFLDLLRAGHADYVINAEALAYMRQRALSGPVIAR